MSQLNPNAAEFVPVSPTRSIPSPACRLLHDAVIAQSPKRPSEIDISLPNPQDFAKEVKSRPSDFDSFSNGHDHEGDQKSPAQDLMENLLNGKSIDEIPEFQPGNTPSKATSGVDEFHFGPNAAPFTPVKLLDQSEAALSTKAVYGDESTLNLDSTLDTSKDNVDFCVIKKEDDPMSMSFYQEKDGDDADPFDLNRVVTLPENIDDFLAKTDDTLPQEDTISDLAKHEPAKDVVSDEIILNNDERIQTTDLDKVDDEKELASPVSNDDESSGVCELSKSPLLQTDDLICQLEFNLPKETLPDVCLRPESKSPQPTADELQIHSPEPELLSPEPEVELLGQSALSPALLSESPALQILSPELIAASPVSQTLSPEPQATSPAPEAISPEPHESTVGPTAPVLSPEPVETVLSPELLEPALSPVPLEPALSPEPQAPILSPESLQEPILTPESQAPVLYPEPEITTQPLISQSLSPEPIENFCRISKSPLLEAASPEPSENVCSIPKSPEPQTVKSPEPEPLIEAVKTEPVDFCAFKAEERKELSIESPVDDITSSVKDVSSPISSPIPDQVVSEQNVLLNFAHEINNAVQSTVRVETSSPIREDHAGPELCPLLTPKSVADTESVATTDVNSFLGRSQISDLTSPLSQDEVTFSTDHPLSKCVYPLPTEIETEHITPEFAEPVVLSPTKDETPSVPSQLEETVKEPEVEAKEPVPAATMAGAAAAVAAATATVVAAATATAVAASTEKKTTKTKTPIAAKKLAPKAAPSPTKAAASPTKARTTPIAKAKPLTTTRTTPTAAKTTTSAATAPKAPLAKATPKPRTTPTTTRTSLEKKPLANGDVKAPVRTSLTSRRSTEGPKPAQAKPPTISLTKPTPPKPAAARPTTAPAKPATTTRPTSTSTFKPRPTTLTSKTTTSTTATKTASSTTTTKLNTARTAALPKASTPPKPRPATAPAKPRVPLTKTVTKTTTDAEKQNKDSANKLTASRTLTSTRTTGTASSRTVTSTARKVESKVTGATRTNVTKTTTTTTRPSVGGKKPLEITRVANKTKTTKIEKPVQNGVTTVVTEQITIVNNAVVKDSDTQLMKDNSPIDNKLLVDTNAAD